MVYILVHIWCMCTRLRGSKLEKIKIIIILKTQIYYYIKGKAY